MNPEFRRQLWLQFSPTRLALLPSLLLTVFVAVFLTATEHPAPALAIAAALLFVFLVGAMGTFAAGASVIDEITDRTWDQQRMSAMQPWAMTWGKLAGATAYGWYGGALCLLVALPAAMLGAQRQWLPQLTLAAILSGVFLHALLIAVNLQLAKVGGRMARRGGIWALVLVLLWGLGPLFAVVRRDGVSWWNLPFNNLDFALASAALFAVCAVGAAWRSMAEMLAVRQWPWGWPALALVATVYLSGFAPGHRLAVLGVVGLGTCAVLTYFALLAEPQSRPSWQRVTTRLALGQWRAACLQLPRWPTTLLLALPFALLTALTLNQHVTLPWAISDQMQLQPLAVVLLMARDCALALFFAFSPKGRRPVLAFAVLMLVLYGLLPWLLGAAGSKLLLQLAQPMWVPGGLSLLIAAVHLAVVLGLLRWRWRATAP
ncbi:MAG: hypothetical protein IPO43_19170 [Rhodoferax sp.]|nr:hypothetical protein [Rhodoferax sp.]